mgnify:CR=1 FL=1
MWFDFLYKQDSCFALVSDWWLIYRSIQSFLCFLMFYQLEEMVNKKSSAKSMVRNKNFEFNKKKLEFRRCKIKWKSELLNNLFCLFIKFFSYSCSGNTGKWKGESWLPWEDHANHASVWLQGNWPTYFKSVLQVSYSMFA